MKLSPNQQEHLISRETPRCDCWGAARQLRAHTSYPCSESKSEPKVWDAGIRLPALPQRSASAWGSALVSLSLTLTTLKLKIIFFLPLLYW